jgi:4a-hydroxytetrahydrobiopterin dehydratase
MDLLNKKCVPCEGGAKPMTKEESQKYLAGVLGWEMSDDGKKIIHTFENSDFAAALSFVNAVGKIAEEEGHHPDIHLVSYKNVIIELSTHAIGGLSENDFIMAAKINAMKS